MKQYGFVTYEGQTYKTVVIGTQTWMAENLNYNASGSKCYDNNEANCTTYGRLYDLVTALSVCPYGWHLPTKAEWEVLGTSTYGLKAISGWIYNGEPSNGSDFYGFSALPGGGSTADRSRFSGLGMYAFWWSNSADSVCLRRIYGTYTDWYCNINYSSSLESVRCLQD